MEFKLGARQEKVVRRLVKSGEYATEKDAIDAAVAVLERYHKKLSGLRQAIQDGLDSGPGAPFDADDIISRGTKRLESKPRG